MKQLLQSYTDEELEQTRTSMINSGKPDNYLLQLVIEKVVNDINEILRERVSIHVCSFDTFVNQTCANKDLEYTMVFKCKCGSLKHTHHYLKT